MSTTRQILVPDVVRARLLDDGARPCATAWSRTMADVPPMRVIVDHVSGAPDVLGGTLSLACIQVGLDGVRDPTMARLIDRALPRRDEMFTDSSRGGPSVALDLWMGEPDWRQQAVGYLTVHWLFPRLVLARTIRRDNPLYVVDDDPDFLDPFAVGLAVEYDGMAVADLWWPSTAPHPSRAYQWVREGAYPALPV